VEGVDSQDLKSLFALNATSDNSAVSFILGSARTRASGQNIQIDITQAAERANLTAASVLADSTVITAANNTIELALDGVTETLTLNEGTYTRQELADHLESVINGASAYGNREASVSLDGDALRVTSASFGTQSQLRIVSGLALQDLGFTAGQAEAGKNVAGSYIVDGVVEAASGSGRVLSGADDNEFTADLQMEIRLASSQVVAGPEADVLVTRGLGATLDEVIGGILDSETGILNTVDEGFDEQIASIQSSIDRQQAAFEREQESLIEQFVALESAIAQLNSTSSFLSSQLASLPSLNANLSR
jgi:flagellar hook-associated protein 2